MAFKKFTGDVAWVAGAQYLALAAGIPIALVTPLFLSPADYGVLGLAAVVTEYLKHYAFGMHASLLRDVPLLRAQGEAARAEGIRDSVWTSTLLLSVPAVLAPAALARWVFGADPRFQAALLLACAATVAAQIGGVPSGLLKAQHRFRRDSALVLVPSLVQVPVTILCVWKFGLLGYLGSQVATMLLVVAMALRLAGEPLRLRLSREAVGAALAVGLPTLVVGLADSAAESLPRLLLQGLWSLELIGVYYFVEKLSRHLIVIPQAVGKVFLPNLMSKLGAAAPGQDISDHVVLPARFLGHGMAFLIGGAALFLPSLVRSVYPRYAAGAEIIPVMFLAAWWTSAGTIAWNHLLGTRNWLQGTAGTVASLGFMAGAFAWAGAGTTLPLAAAIASAGLALRNALFLVRSLGALSRKSSDVPLRLARLVAPFAVLAAGVWAIGRYWPAHVAPRLGLHPVADGALQAAAFGLAYAPLLLAFYRRHGAFLRATPAALPEDQADGGPELA